MYAFHSLHIFLKLLACFHAQKYISYYHDNYVLFPAKDEKHTADVDLV